MIFAGKNDSLQFYEKLFSMKEKIYGMMKKRTMPLVIDIKRAKGIERCFEGISGIGMAIKKMEISNETVRNLLSISQTQGGIAK